MNWPVPQQCWERLVTAGGNCLFELAELCVVFISPPPPKPLNSCPDPGPPFMPFSTPTHSSSICPISRSAVGVLFLFLKDIEYHARQFFSPSIIKHMPSESLCCPGRDVSNAVTSGIVSTFWKKASIYVCMLFHIQSVESVNMNTEW